MLLDHIIHSIFLGSAFVPDLPLSIISGTGAAICTAVVVVQYNSRW
jgi:hypothetical protein